MRIFKLTDAGGADVDGVRWGPGTTRLAGAGGPKAMFGYRSETDAAAFGPAFDRGHCSTLWEATTFGPLIDGLRMRCEGMTTIGPVAAFRELSPAHHVALAVDCARDVFASSSYSRWASAWLAGVDQSTGRIEELIRELEEPWLREIGTTPELIPTSKLDQDAALHAARAALALLGGNAGTNPALLAAQSVISASHAGGAGLSLDDRVRKVFVRYAMAAPGNAGRGGSGK